MACVPRSHPARWTLRVTVSQVVVAVVQTLVLFIWLLLSLLPDARTIQVVTAAAGVHELGEAVSEYTPREQPAAAVPRPSSARCQISPCTAVTRMFGTATH
jgi:hypothetical protein